MLSRVLPGSVVVIAALTLPELSVGAGDFGGPAKGTGERDDPPRPVPVADQSRVRLASAPVSSVLTGVRYAPILDLAPDVAREAVIPAASSAPLIAPFPSPAAPAGQGPALADPPAPSLPEVESPAPVIATRTMPPAPGLAAELVAPEAPPPVSEPSTAPAADISTNMVQAPPPALTVPAGLAGPREAEPPVPTVPSALPPVQMAAVSAPAVPAPMPAGRGAIDQVAVASVAPPVPPAPVAAVQPVSRPAPSAPARIAAAPVAAKPVVAAAPGTRPAAQAPAVTARPVPAAPPPVAAAVAPTPRPALAAPASAASSPYRFDVKSQLVTRVDGKTAGAVDFQQTPTGLAVRLGSIVEVLADRYDPAQLARIRGSAAGNAYVSLSDLQAQGIPISYDPVYDEFNVGLTDTRPKNAHKVHMDQISTPMFGR